MNVDGNVGYKKLFWDRKIKAGGRWAQKDLAEQETLSRSGRQAVSNK
jgi:hypothetical protein